MKYHVKRADIVRLAITNAQIGHHAPLCKLIDRLLIDCKLPIPRIAKTAERYFGIPKEITENTFSHYV